MSVNKINSDNDVEFLWPRKMNTKRKVVIKKWKWQKITKMETFFKME